MNWNTFSKYFDLFFPIIIFVFIYYMGGTLDQMLLGIIAVSIYTIMGFMLQGMTIKPIKQNQQQL